MRRSLWPIYHPDRLGTERFVQADLATTLAHVASDGAEEFYRGALARRIAEAASRAGSPLAAADLAEHRADWVEPLRLRYREGEAVSLPPPTQGFAALAILALLEGFDVASLDDTDHVHLAVEATKLALEDRDRYLADPTVVDVPVARCLDPDRVARRRALISRRAARPVDGRPADGDTIAIVTADAAGNAVSMIQSLYHEFGSGSWPATPASCCRTAARTSHSTRATPITWRRASAPRTRSSRPCIWSAVVRRLVYGTMGGDGQPQTQAALVTRVVDRGLGPQSAIEAPRWLFGRTWGETSRGLRIESRFDPGVAEALRRRGHDVQVVEAWSDLMGHAHLIRLDDRGLSGGSDPRADGAALGW